MKKYLTDYLPIKKPLETKPDSNFYDTIAKPLIKDVVQLANVGIPVNIEKIKELEKLLDNVIKEHTDKINNNKIVKYFIRSQISRSNEELINQAIKPLENKKHALELNLKRNKHINLLVDVIIEDLIEQKLLSDNYRRTNDTENWTIKKLKTIYLLTNSCIIEKVIKKDYDSSLLNPFKEKVKILLEKEIDDTITSKINKIKETNVFSFNPKSSVQIKELFSYLSIPSRFKTDTGSDSFNKTALKELLEVVNNAIEKIDEEG